MPQHQWMTRISQIILAITISTFTANHAEAMSCLTKTLDGAEARAELASRRHSPFNLMIASSFIGNIGASIALGNETSNPEDISTESSIGILMWLASGMIWSQELCAPIVSDAEMTSVITPGDIDESQFLWKRGLFLAIHTFNTLPTLAFALKSDHEAKWSLVAGAVLFPAVADVILRATVFRDRVSPWSFTPSFVMNDREIQPVLSARYTW